MEIDKIELKRLAEAATPGPWYVQYGDDEQFMCMTAVSTNNRRKQNEGQFDSEDDGIVAVTYHQTYPFVSPDDTSDGNSAYIAAANPATVLHLLSEIARLTAENKALGEALQHIAEYWNRSENDRAMNDALYHMIETAEAALSLREQGK